MATPNEHGVFVNHEVVTIIDDKFFECKLLVAKYQGRYYSGYSYQKRGCGEGCGGGGGFPAKGQYRDSFPTRSLALADPIDHLVKFFSIPHPRGRSTKKILLELNKYKEQQLTFKFAS